MKLHYIQDHYFVTCETPVLTVFKDMKHHIALRRSLSLSPLIINHLRDTLLLMQGTFLMFVRKWRKISHLCWFSYRSTVYEKRTWSRNKKQTSQKKILHNHENMKDYHIQYTWQVHVPSFYQWYPHKKREKRTLAKLLKLHQIITNNKNKSCIQGMGT